jgi:hypothetical protein
VTIGESGTNYCACTPALQKDYRKAVADRSPTRQIGPGQGVLRARGIELFALQRPRPFRQQLLCRLIAVDERERQLRLRIEQVRLAPLIPLIPFLRTGAIGHCGR